MFVALGASSGCSADRSVGEVVGAGGASGSGGTDASSSDGAGGFIEVKPKCGSTPAVLVASSTYVASDAGPTDVVLPHLAVTETDLYYILNFHRPTDGAAPIPGRVMRVPLSGGQPTLVASSPHPISLLLTSTSVVFGDEGGVSTVPLDGGTPTLVAATNGAPTALSTDGENLYFAETGVTKSVPLAGAWLSVYEYSGLSQTRPLDAIAAAQGSGNAVATTGASTTASPVELVFVGAGFVNDFTGPVTGSQDYTVEAQDVGTSRAATETMNTQFTGSVVGSFNLSQPTNWSAVLATFTP